MPTVTRPHATVPRGFISRWILDFHNRTVLFRAGNWVFTTYAFIAGTAFFIGFSVAMWYAGMLGVDTVQLAKLYLFVLVPCILVGLRVFSIMLEWRELFRRPVQTIIKPGYMLHGGIAGGVVGMTIIAYLMGISPIYLLDGAAFCMPLGEAIARLGCYVYGCCWGRPTNSNFGIRYTSKDSKVVRCAPHLENVKIHPAQLYALVGYLGLFAVFYALLPYAPFAGFLAGLYLISHSLIRWSLEYFRQDDRGRLWGKLTHTNLYSIIAVLGGFGFLAYGAVAGLPSTPNLSYRLVHFWSDMSLLPWVILIGMVFGAAYGVHYKKVGSWLSSPSGGMNPNVDELSMGAVQRMESAARRDADRDADRD